LVADHALRYLEVSLTRLRLRGVIFVKRTILKPATALVAYSRLSGVTALDGGEDDGRGFSSK
jgi:hypothetical protein